MQIQTLNFALAQNSKGPNLPVNVQTFLRNY